MKKIDEGTNLPITQLTSLQVNYRDKHSCLGAPNMTTEQRNKLENTKDSANPIKNGTIIYNTTTNELQVFENGVWVASGGDGDVQGPAGPVENNAVVVFDGTSGKLIKQAGIAVQPLGKQAENNNLNNNVSYQISNLGALQFGSSTNHVEVGSILLNDLTPVSFHTQGSGVNAQVCSVYGGELPEGSSTPSGLVEIKSTTGGFLNSRLTTLQRDALVNPVDGLQIYNTDTKALDVRAGGKWIDLQENTSTGYLNVTHVDFNTRPGNSYTVGSTDRFIFVKGFDKYKNTYISLPVLGTSQTMLGREISIMLEGVQESVGEIPQPLVYIRPFASADKIVQDGKVVLQIRLPSATSYITFIADIGGVWRVTSNTTGIIPAVKMNTVEITSNYFWKLENNINLISSNTTAGDNTIALCSIFNDYGPEVVSDAIGTVLYIKDSYGVTGHNTYISPISLEPTQRVSNINGSTSTRSLNTTFGGISLIYMGYYALHGYTEQRDQWITIDSHFNIPAPTLKSKGFFKNLFSKKG